MTLKERYEGFLADLSELKTAAQAHNVASYEPPESSSSKPTEGRPTTADTNKPSSPITTTTTAIQPATVISAEQPGATVPQQAYAPPPPPPKNLPHGWTARYDEKEGKFAYSHGVTDKTEKWDLPGEKVTEKPTVENSP